MEVIDYIDLHNSRQWDTAPEEKKAFDEFYRRMRTLVKESARHILHVDCNDFRDSDINEIVIDVGNPEGGGHSFTIIPNER